MKKIQTIRFPDEARILVTSDIHANLARFKKLLKKMKYDKNRDYLIIVGDIVEKGPNNMQFLEYIKSLEENVDHVFVLEGNCDALIDDLIKGENYIPYLKKQPLSLMNEWLTTLELSILKDEITPEELKDIFCSHFPEEIRWLQERPTVLESEDFIFVHAGIPNGIKNDTRQTMITFRHFQTTGHPEEKMVIVGHFPVINYYDYGHSDLSIIIDEEKRMISLDGGNQLNDTGQLNGLIISKNKQSISYEQCSVDDFPKAIVTKEYVAPEVKMRNVSWPYGYQRGKVIKRGPDFSECSVVDIEEVCIFKNEYLKVYEDGTYDLLRHHTAHLLTVNKGDAIKIIDATCSSYVYIKKNNVLGWIPKSAITP